MAELLKSPSKMKWPEAVVVGLSFVILLIVLDSRVTTLFHPDLFHEELRILYHLDPERTNSKDYVGRFLGEFSQPPLYALVTKASLDLGIDFIVFHKLVAVICSVLLFSGMALAAQRIGGFLLAIVAVCLTAIQPLFLYQISSATPHAFAFPLLAWTLVCLLYDRAFLLACLTVLSGLLYPPMSPVLGLCLAWQIIIVHKGLNASCFRRMINMLVLGVTAAISLGLLWYQIAPIDGYGAGIKPGTQIHLYPENGPDGRHFAGVFHPVGYVADVTVGQFRNSLPVLLILAVCISLIVISGLGLYQLRHKPPYFHALLGFLIPSATICLLITQLAPYVAYRYLLYPSLTLLPLLVGLGLHRLFYRNRSSSTLAAALMVGTLAPLAWALNGPSLYVTAPLLQLDESSKQLMRYLRGVPGDSLIAAWPRAQTSLIPYVAGRPLFVNYKAHYPSYEGYVAGMRARMFDLIDVYLTEDTESLIGFHCRWQVDYLIIEKGLLSNPSGGLKYFAPFDSRVEQILKTVDKQSLLLRDPPENAVVFEAGRYSVLKLALLSRELNC